MSREKEVDWAAVERRQDRVRWPVGGRTRGSDVGFVGSGRQLTPEIARAAAADAGTRSMRAGGRTAWSREDYNRAVAAYDRILPLETEMRYMGAVPDDEERSRRSKPVRVRGSRRARKHRRRRPGSGGNWYTNFGRTGRYEQGGGRQHNRP